jgi:hypothetical protein
MIFEIIERKLPQEEITPEKCFYSHKNIYYKMDNPYFRAVSVGDTIKKATLNLMIELELILGITIYVGLLIKEDSLFDGGTEVIKYNMENTRMTLSEYKDCFYKDSVLVRGVKTNIDTGQKYIDRDLYPVDEFETYFTTNPIYPLRSFISKKA